MTANGGLVPGALHTDLYELNMAASYLRRGMTEDATFSLFVRHLPPGRGFLVAAGVEDCLDFLESFRFEEDELAYLSRDLGFDAQAVDAFRSLRFQGDVWAVPEGTIVLAGEPILEVTASLPQGQLLETALLNEVTFQTTIASKAARCRIAADGRDLVDFAFRRTQGLDAAMDVARCTAMAGFVATSNVEAARRFGLRAAGTMAHSYIEAFPTEEDAFRAFAADFPTRTTFLVDTYDTLEGVRKVIQVVDELGLRDKGDRIGIRLDSGDLAGLARAARAVLDDAGLREVRIFASGGLDEHDIEDLVAAGAPIDAFGVGTKVGVSADAPSLDTVYKLVTYADRPVLKLSTAKVTAPGAKQVFRAAGFAGDVIGLRDEAAPSGSTPLLRPVMSGARRIAPRVPLDQARARFEADLAELPETARRIREPIAPSVSESAALTDLTRRVRQDIAARAGASGST